MNKYQKILINIILLFGVFFMGIAVYIIVCLLLHIPL